MAAVSGVNESCGAAMATVTTRRRHPIVRRRPVERVVRNTGDMSASNTVLVFPTSFVTVVLLCHHYGGFLPGVVDEMRRLCVMRM